jgi:hypothetical protein
MRSKGLFLISLSALPSTGSGATLFDDNFDYSDGNLAGNAGWANHSGTGSLIQVSSSTVIMSHGSGSREDINITFAPTNSGTLSALFTLTVNNDAPISGSDFEYFAHFGTGGGEGNSVTDFVSRLDIVAPADSEGFDFTLGLSSKSSTAELVYGNDFTFGSPITVLLDYNIDAGLSSLKINSGDTVTTETVGPTGLDFSAFAFRQSNSSSDETITIGSLTISDSTTIPEPSSALLGILSLLGLLRRRR